jgi:hypothetical protein
MEQAGFLVLAWFAIGCLVALVIGQIIRTGSRAYDRQSIICKASHRARTPGSGEARRAWQRRKSKSGLRVEASQ